MSLSPDPLLREVEEDLRRERYEKLWKKYGGAVIGAAVVVVLVVAGYKGWQAYDQNAREEAGELFVQASDSANTDADAAARAFLDLSEHAPEGYAFLSQLRAAALFAEAHDPEHATKIYSHLEQTADHELHKDIAVLFRAFTMLNNSADTERDDQALSAILEPLTAPGRPMRYSARELLAFAALARGDRKRASEIFDELREDPATPADMLQRAEHFLTQICQG